MPGSLRANGALIALVFEPDNGLKVSAPGEGALP